MLDTHFANGSPDMIPVNAQDSIELFLNLFVLHTILSGNMSGRACKIPLLSSSLMYSTTHLLECLSISFFYLILTLLFSNFHLFYLLLFHYSSWPPLCSLSLPIPSFLSLRLSVWHHCSPADCCACRPKV